MDILICGVGGQGVLTLAHTIGKAAMLEDKNVVIGEVHGMAQRGGSVVCTLRLGAGSSHYISSADVIISFELAEVLRYLNKASADTTIVLNERKILPFQAAIGEEDYPQRESILKEIQGITSHLYLIDARKLAIQAGNPIVENMVLLGALLGLDRLQIPKNRIEEVLSKGRYIEENTRAINLGYEVIRHS